MQLNLITSESLAQAQSETFSASNLKAWLDQPELNPLATESSVGARSPSSSLQQSVIPPEHLVVGDLISRGANGQVMCGRYDDSPVAVKQIFSQLLMLPGDEDDIIAEISREVVALSKLAHPYVISFYGISKCWEKQYESQVLSIVMEYVPNSLTSLLQQPGTSLHSQAPEKLKRVSWQVASALEYLHNKGIFHMDLKTDNVLVDTRDGETVCKLCDFGLAALKGEVRVVGGVKEFQFSVSGTPGYLAPEACSLILTHRVNRMPHGHNICCKKIDVYAFGVLLCAMVTGGDPFSEFEGSGTDLMEATMAGKTPDLPVCALVGYRELAARCMVGVAERPFMCNVLALVQLLGCGTNFDGQSEAELKLNSADSATIVVP
eukprot:TRINITY_DN12045_c0_g1_i8.p1 TRINITY_DN12045_c0_g1~~TRINITY_DN12045_c0_g1_i8.p1  ORF type:complete len:377 (-),score=62.53 TRINITY_DN12045_c0_g1_i8:119-1249(-)